MLSRKLYKDWMADTQRAKLKQIVSMIKPKGRILDVGAGPGFLEELLPSAIATDIDLENLKLVKGLKVKASGDALPFKTGSFDAVFCIDTLHLLKGARELARVAKKGGKLIVSAFCNQQNSQRKMTELKERFKGFKVIDGFYAETPREWDATLVCSAP
jgi:SAM-dependent methyltransferase